MAPQNNLFLNFLKILNIDLKEFSDPSFDNISKETDLQVFLHWLSNNLDSTNVVGIDDLISSQPQDNAETFHENSYRLAKLSEILENEESRLQNYHRKSPELRGIEARLQKREKEAVSRLNEARKSLAYDTSVDNASELEDEIEKTYKMCLGAQPYLPDIPAYSSLADSLFEATKTFYSEQIVGVEDIISERKGRELRIENIEEILVDSENALRASIEKFISACEGTNCELTSECMKLSSKEVVDRRLRGRELEDLSQELSEAEYFTSVLKSNQELLTRCLTVTATSNGVIRTHLHRAEALSNSTEAFICLVEKDSETVRALLTRTNDVPSPDEVDGNKMSKLAPKPKTTYSELLRHLCNEFEWNSQSWESISRIVKHFRSGPSLEFLLVPIPLSITMLGINEKRAKFTARIRQLAGKYSQMKTELKKRDREQRLLWVYFLVDPLRLTARYHEASTFHSVSSIKHNGTNWL